MLDPLTATAAALELAVARAHNVMARKPTNAYAAESRSDGSSHATLPITELIDAEVSAGRYEPPIDPATLSYALVRLAEAFLFSDAAAGMRGDVDRLNEVQAALLGVAPRGARHRR